MHTHLFSQFTEEQFTLRNKNVHLQQCRFIERPGIREDEKQHYSKVYGVNRMSILCDLPYFDVTAQLPQDVMHLLFEGLYHFQIKVFLNYILNETHVSIEINVVYKQSNLYMIIAKYNLLVPFSILKAMTLLEFNERVRNFPYAYFEDRPHSITASHLIKGILGQTGMFMYDLYILYLLCCNLRFSSHYFQLLHSMQLMKFGNCIIFYLFWLGILLYQRMNIFIVSSSYKKSPQFYVQM